jgi:hypothetical protein
MKKVFFLIYLTTSLLLLSCASKSEKRIVVEKFVAALLSDSLAVNNVTSFFENGKDEKMKTYVRALRADLKERSIKLEDIAVLPYVAAEEELKHLASKEKENVFAVLKGGRLVFPVLVNNQKKIVTCTAFRKGDRGYFLIL